MKIVIGVDNQGAFPPAVKLVSSLKFPEPEVTLLHAINTALPLVPFGLDSGLEVQNEYGKVVNNLGHAALQYAMEMCHERGLEATAKLRSGGANEVINEECDEKCVDIVAVATHLRSMWSPTFVGSVSRGLAISCHSSVLACKGQIPEGRKLNAVLATDHSDYSTRWIEHFLQMRPTGIGSIRVTTAYDVNDHEADILHRNLPALGGMVDTWIEERLGNRSAELVQRLEKAGYKAKYDVQKGDTNDVIRKAMQEEQADLLIVGAQGHGFLERVLIGSVSLHQTVYEPYSVLIVRA